MPHADDGGMETLLKEKDAEIADLRARLDDKEKMVSALRSATRKRDIADLGLDTSATPEIKGGSSGSVDPSDKPATSTSPMTTRALGADRRKKSVDEVTKMLDELIDQKIHAERVDSGVLMNKSSQARRSSVRKTNSSGP